MPDVVEDFFASLSRIPKWRKVIWRVSGWPSRFRYWVKRNTLYRWQRGSRGWADCDTWSFDQYLARVIAAGVRRQLGSAYFGHPVIPGVCTPDHADPCPGEVAFRHDLETLAAGFEAYSTSLSGSPSDSFRDEELDASLALLAKHFRGLWD